MCPKWRPWIWSPTVLPGRWKPRARLALKLAGKRAVSERHKRAHRNKITQRPGAGTPTGQNGFEGIRGGQRSVPYMPGPDAASFSQRSFCTFQCLPQEPGRIRRCEGHTRTHTQHSHTHRVQATVCPWTLIWMEHLEKFWKSLDLSVFGFVPFSASRIHQRQCLPLALASVTLYIHDTPASRRGPRIH